MYAYKLDFENRESLESNLAQLERELKLNSVPAMAPADLTIEAFSKLPSDQQKLLLSNISTFIRVLSQEIEPELDRSPRVREVARLKSALRQFGLRVKSEDVFNVVSLEDVIELYNIQGIQLYRNMRFFKVCSYNLLDLAIHSWETLYDKPKSAFEATQRLVQSLFTSDGRPMPYSLKPYLQKEKMGFANLLKTVEVAPRYLVPVYDMHSDELAGAFSTYTANVVAEGAQSSRFDTI